jgi:hypothetical protein
MIYRAHDLIVTNWAIGRGTVVIVKEDRAAGPFPPVLPAGAIGQVISDIKGELLAYLEDKATNALHTVRIPLGSRGKIESRQGGKSWA